VKDGLQAKSRRGAIGETWWSQRFLHVLEEFNDPGRLSRGRAYARRGQVIDMDIEAGEVTARVQGSRARPYDVSIGVAVLDDAAWTRVEKVLASRAVFLARLLAGEMPQEIEEAFDAASLSLFPAAPRDVDTDCSCPDWENPCKHVAAAYYLLAEAFDRDPFLIFAWRGRPRERLLAELRELRGLASGTPAPDPADEQSPAALDAVGLFGPGGLEDPDLAGELTDETASRFWEAGRDLASIRVEPRVVAMPEAILRDLGPSGLLAGGRPLEDLLHPLTRQSRLRPSGWPPARNKQSRTGARLRVEPLRAEPLRACRSRRHGGRLARSWSAWSMRPRWTATMNPKSEPASSR
jgi:uncharacterized Zn finger protein